MFEFILENYGPQIFEFICAVIIAPIFTYLGIRAKALYEQYVNTKVKRDVVETSVKYVQQRYKDLSGAEKKQKAIEYISAMLAEKGIPITELEMEMLLESAVYAFKQGIKTPAQIEETTTPVVGEPSNYTEAVAAALNGGVNDD